MSDLGKINLFLDEILRRCKQSPQFVASEQFFRLWQDSCQPLPFILPENGLKLLGKAVFQKAAKTEDNAQPSIVRIQWNTQESCPMIICETGYDAVTKLLRISEQGVTFEKGETLSNPLDNNILGEHVEAMFEVAKYLKDTYPQLDLSKAKDNYLTPALEKLASGENSDVYRKILRFRQCDRMRLMQKVIADMAEDEFSSQLTLGLDFTDAPAQEAAEDDEPLTDCTLQKRGKWEVELDVNLLCETEAERLKSERSFVFNFQHAVPISPLQDTRQAIQMPCSDDMLEYLHDGAKFVLFAKSAPRIIIGIFQMEVYEDKSIIGFIEWAEKAFAVPLDENLCAMPRKSPQEYITRSLEVFRKTVLENAEDDLDALRSLLGLRPLPVAFPNLQHSNDFPKLDIWQTYAVQTCLNEANPIVIVQGPPGTGKTSVLEVVIRQFAQKHARILVTAPSNTAVDNICKRIKDLPLLRHANQPDAIAADIAADCWAGNDDCLAAFNARQEQMQCEIHAGTHIGLLRSPIIASKIDEHNVFDIIIFDEAGMSRTAEAMLCLCLARRAFIFGDPQQLPPFPLPESIWQTLRNTHDVITQSQIDFIGNGLLAWLQIHRKCPAILLRTCYRCHNPRLMRFASLLFYNALVKSDTESAYFKLSYRDRQALYPPSSLQFVSTSRLPEELRQEQLRFDGFQPGYENMAEAKICVRFILDGLQKFPLDEITVISPYKKQVKLIRRLLAACPHDVDDKTWTTFTHERIATVDSFQGGESDLVIISYVRSGGTGVGFVDDPNRVNVTHTRCRKEMHVIGDLDFLRENAENKIFQRMERSFIRDGIIREITLDDFQALNDALPKPCIDEAEAVELQAQQLAREPNDALPPQDADSPQQTQTPPIPQET